MENDEIWKDIEGYENKYQVSNMGNVRSICFNNQKGVIKNLFLKYGKRQKQVTVKLSKNNIAKDYIVARLVAKAFIKGYNENFSVMHKNGIEDDNRVENLQIAYNRSQIHYQMYKNKHRKIGKWTGNKITISGKRYKSLSEYARSNNINIQSLYSRLFDGWSIDLTDKVEFSKNNNGNKPNFYEYNGELITIKQIAKKYNIKETTVQTRLRLGWTIDEIINIKVGRSYR